MTADAATSLHLRTTRKFGVIAERSSPKQEKRRRITLVRAGIITVSDKAHRANGKTRAAPSSLEMLAAPPFHVETVIIPT
jgi:hypothetical protein